MLLLELLVLKLYILLQQLKGFVPLRILVQSTQFHLLFFIEFHAKKIVQLTKIIHFKHL